MKAKQAGKWDPREFYEVRIGHYNDNNIDFALSNITNFLNIACKAGGSVFGGFVRDVIVPLNTTKSTKGLNFKDVDIWFKNEGQVKDLLADMEKVSGLALMSWNLIDKVNPSRPADFQRARYGFTRQTYALFDTSKEKYRFVAML